MTPLVKDMAGRWPQAELYSWFDLGDLSGEVRTISVDSVALIHLPFERTMLCGRERSGEKFALSLVDRGDHISVVGMVQSASTPSGYTAFGMFNYQDTDRGLAFLKGHKNDPEPDKQDCMNVLAIIDSAFAKINAGATAYRAATKPNSPTNQRRAKQGKPPLIYDWHTVNLPAKPSASAGLGGTHASPRHHERRGHWRNLASGKRVFVKQCKVGDASKGTVFKDYKVGAGGTATKAPNDAVSVFMAGCTVADTEAAVFVVKGPEAIAYLRELCKRQGLLTDKPVAGPVCNDCHKTPNVRAKPTKEAARHDRSEQT